MEIVDIYSPPKFEPTGVSKPIIEAINNGDRIATCNIRIVNKNKKSVLYQIRDLTSSREPGKFDVSAAGHYNMGESGLDGLREAKEELGVDFSTHEVLFLGRRLNVSIDTIGRERKNIIYLYMINVNLELEDFVIDPKEVYGICYLEVDNLLAIFENNKASAVQMLTSEGKIEDKVVDKNQFPYNRDNYHYKMARIIDKYFGGEMNILY